MARIHIRPLTLERWSDFTMLFGQRGACAGCWCMWWRLSAGEWRANKGTSNRRAHRALLSRNGPTGLIAYSARQPIAWISLGPRFHFPRLATSRILKPVDDEEVWSVVCFFVHRERRGQGLTVRLLNEAAIFARRHGARILEGYPVEPGRRQPDVFMYTGSAAAFRKAGFQEVARRSDSRPIMRRVLP